MRVVLEGATIKRLQVRHHRGDLRGACGSAVIPQIQLGRNHRVLVIHWAQIAGVNNHRTGHAVGNVHGHGMRRAVVHPDTGCLGREGVFQRLPGIDRLHGLIRRNIARVEVQRMPHGPFVFEGDVEGVADLPSKGGGGSVPVESPDRPADILAQVLHDIVAGNQGVVVVFFFRGRCNLSGIGIDFRRVGSQLVRGGDSRSRCNLVVVGGAARARAC